MSPFDHDHELSSAWIYGIIYYRMGPLQTDGCMRMEAKNNYFKKAGRIGNFKNVPYSVAKRHQKLMAAHLQGRFFSYNELECGPCKYH